MTVIQLEDGRHFQVPAEMIPPEPERDPDNGIYFALLEMLKGGELPEGVTEITKGET